MTSLWQSNSTLPIYTTFMTLNTFPLCTSTLFQTEVKKKKKTNLRAKKGEVTLAGWPSVEMVEGARLLDQIACDMVKVSIVLGLLQHLPRLLLEEPHLFGNHLKLVADVGMHEGVCLR